MRVLTPLSLGWTFADGFDPAWTTAPLTGAEVELPHTAVELPFNYFDETRYQRAFTYQRRIDWSPEMEGREVHAEFEGAMADATVWLNGVEILRHFDGYTPFAARLTPHLVRGENLLTVRIDGSENPEIPPFGGQIDYLTYAGIYREAHLRVTGPRWIEAIKVETPAPVGSVARVKVQLSAPAPVVITLLGPEGAELRRAEVSEGADVEHSFEGLDLALWSPDSPVQYRIRVDLPGEDRLETKFGAREARFTPEGFLLNGQKMKLMGLNRHQSFPYSGYAQGARSQARDAEILKWDLGCNIVRTSHYPQSRHFLDRCDEIGLLVFEEIPGWQHIGGKEWQARSVDNVRAMIRRDWNRPSIVIWGVRINESQDNHEFYAETNRVARDLDPTRQTGGVRYITESEFLEDVYTMNDFVMGEFENPMSNRPRMALRSQRETTGQTKPVPYLVTEYNGHMFPTKAGDQEQRMAEHALRHLEVLNAAFGDPNISGCIGWCYADYNTHKDFGSGDRICHHGVTTMFREPKFAAFAYASQRPIEAGIVMEPATYYARGERNIGGILPLIVMTNCDEVEFRYGDSIVKRVGPDRERFPHLPHPPVVLDHRHFSREELGLWGMRWEPSEVIGFVGGVEVARRAYVADPLPTMLELRADAETLSAAARDEVRVMIRARDQAGNVLPFLQDMARIEVTGPARLIGPAATPLRGGTTGFWLRASGPGEIGVTVRTETFAPVTLTLRAV